MKKIVAVALLLALLAALCPSVGADAWIPPENYNHALVASPKEDGACYALNVFISNYAEMGRDAWAGKSPDDVCIAGVLKHFELNPGVYPEDVFSYTAPDGTRYMAISEEKFEKRLNDLFGRKVSAKEHPGYHDGYVWVTAENFGAPISVYASVMDCFADSENLYTVTFTIYHCTDSSFTNRYGTSYYNLPENRGEVLASGFAQFYYWGPTDASTFYAYEFELEYYRLYETDVEFPYQNPNLPADISALPTEAPESTEATTEPPETTVATTAPPESTQASTEAPTTEAPRPSEGSTVPESSEGASQGVGTQEKGSLADRLGLTGKDPHSMIPPEEDEEENRSRAKEAETSLFPEYLVPILLILVVCLAAVVVILLIFRKKKT